MKKIVFFLLFATGLSGCLLHPETNRAALVLVNNLDKPVMYQLNVSGKWFEATVLDSKAREFVLEYEESDGNSLPPGLNGIRINVQTCRFEIAEKEFKKSFSKDNSGRHGWNLNINTALLHSHGC
jgi:hypothetical protein